jgi:hypothetical protein
MLMLRAAFLDAMRLLFLIPLLALPACGLYDDSMPADGSFAGGGSGGGSSAPQPSVECAPKSFGSQTGELVPSSPLISHGVEAHGCDPSFPGDVQYSWTAPATGCYLITTAAIDRPAKNILKVTRDTCDGAPVLCSTDNYGYSGPLGPLAQGERLVIAFTKIEAETFAVNHVLHISGPQNCPPR